MSDPKTSVSASHANLTQEEWERSAFVHLEEGQNFLAQDVSREGLSRFPNSHKLRQYGAVALSQTGAIEEARRVVQPLLDEILIDETPFRRLHETLKKAVSMLGKEKGEPSMDALAAMADLSSAIDSVRGKKLDASTDAETCRFLGQVCRELWRHSSDRDDLLNCRNLFLQAFDLSGNARDGMDAAAMSLLLAEGDKARRLAAKVRDSFHDDAWRPDDDFRTKATLGEALVLLGESDKALEIFTRLSRQTGRRYSGKVATLKQLQLLQDGGIDVPEDIFAAIKPPAVVVFTGHMIDRPGEPSRFSPHLEQAVAREIKLRLDRLDAQIGYSMASCGSDLLFIEAMLERGAEVNIVLPFEIEDFVAANVRYAGAKWEMRFRNALKLANTVTFATEERYLGHDMLYRFANQVLHGVATLRTGFLCTSPYLLAVWDMMTDLVGGAAEFIDQWEDITHLQIIDLDDVAQGAEAEPEPDEHLGHLADAFAVPPREAPAAGTERVIKSMLFADIAGYSALKDEHIPGYLEFLTRLREGMEATGAVPESINTWGDAIFAVMGRATEMADYALNLKEIIKDIGPRITSLPKPLNIRISLHAGPVFEAVDPVTQRRNYYGSHINRAARLEPVTVIGHVYATQQFVALLTAEQSAARTEAERIGEPFDDRFVCEYVGVLSLAKNFGRQTVYHLRHKPGAEIAALAGQAAE